MKLELERLHMQLRFRSTWLTELALGVAVGGVPAQLMAQSGLYQGFGDRPCLSGNAIDGDRGATKDVVLSKGTLSLNPHIVGHTGSINRKSSVAAACKSRRRIRSRKGAHVDHW